MLLNTILKILALNKFCSNELQRIVFVLNLAKQEQLNYSITLECSQCVNLSFDTGAKLSWKINFYGSRGIIYFTIKYSALSANP